METRCLWYVGLLVALVAGCQSDPVSPNSKAIGYKPTAPASSKTASSGKKHEGQQASYSRPVESSDASDDPSALEKLTSGTKGMFSRAGQALSPTSGRAESKNGWATPSRQAQAKKKKPKKPSAFYTWLHPEPKQPRTLKEWMSQERLDP